MNAPDVPVGMALRCKHCGWFPSEGLSMGVVVAHFDTEHHTTEVHLELVVLCQRCDTPMEFERTLTAQNGFRDVFYCHTCHRVRQVTRHEP